MGNRYILEIKCPNEKCGFVDESAYYAPTCGFTTWKCPDCRTVVDLEELTGITKEAASNSNEIKEILARVAGE